MHGILKYIALNAIFSKSVICRTLSQKSPLRKHFHTPNFIVSYPEGLVYIIYQSYPDLYYILFLKTCRKYFFLWLLTEFLDVMLNKSTKWNMNFRPGFIQCSDFCSVCKTVHIYFNNASFAYLNITFQKTFNAKKKKVLMSGVSPLFPLYTDRVQNTTSRDA